MRVLVCRPFLWSRIEALALPRFSRCYSISAKKALTRKGHLLDENWNLFLLSYLFCVDTLIQAIKSSFLDHHSWHLSFSAVSQKPSCFPFSVCTRVWHPDNLSSVLFSVVSSSGQVWWSFLLSFKTTNSFVAEVGKFGMRIFLASSRRTFFLLPLRLMSRLPFFAAQYCCCSKQTTIHRSGECYEKV